MLLGRGRQERGYYLGGKLYGFSCLNLPVLNINTKEKKLEKYVIIHMIRS
jgi:hypothetical protein